MTAIYDDEASEPDLMVHRLRDACARLPPIQLGLGEVASFEAPNEGLYVTATAGASFVELRSQVLRPPFAPRSASMRPHVTILHPRSVAASTVDWRSYIGTKIGWCAVAREVKVIEYDGRVWRVLTSIPLAQV